MSTIFDNDILIHHIAAPGLPGDGFTAPEATVIRDDLDDLLARPVITKLDDVPDVNASSPTNGQALAWDSASSTWKPVGVGSPVSTQSGGAGTLFGPVSIFDFRTGLTVAQHSTYPTLAIVTPVYGTTANTIAQGNHAHVMYLDRAFPFAETGTLSGGTRTLVSDVVTGLDPAKSFVLKGRLYLHLRGDGSGASFARPRITISGNPMDMFENARIVAGVLITEITPHTGLLVSGVSSVAVSATVAFHPGDPVYVGGGVLVIEIQANR